MASVWYIGKANVRNALGHRWARENGWSIPEAEFTMDQLEELIGDPLFARGKPDGPRQMLAIPGSNPMDETFYLYYTEIMKILDNLDGYGLSFDGKVQIYDQLPTNAPNDTLWLVIDDEMVYYRDNNVWPAQGQGIKLAGRDGADGENGLDGTNGVDGTNGTNGTDGVDGEDGLDGEDGVSVSSVTAVGTMMKIVLSNGTEFSFEMPPGPKGDQGLPGGVLTVAGFGGNVTKEQLGINNVDNTRDADKEISGPVQTAFDFMSAAFGNSLSQLQTELAEKQDEPQVNAIVSAAISNLVGGAPASLDTLYEIAAALQGNTGTIGDLVTAIGLRAMADAVMNLTGNQSVSGTKNFTGTLQKSGKDVVVTDDARLSNARTPTTHTHVVTDVNGLESNMISMSNATQAAYDLANTKAKSSRAGLDLWFGSQSEFDALPNSQKIANGFVGFVRG